MAFPFGSREMAENMILDSEGLGEVIRDIFRGHFRFEWRRKVQRQLHILPSYFASVIGWSLHFCFCRYLALMMFNQVTIFMLLNYNFPSNIRIYNLFNRIYDMLTLKVIFNIARNV